MIKRFLESRRRVFAPPSALPIHSRAYVVGDIHGRLDLLDSLLDQIDADERQRGAIPTDLIFLGDLVDRGPDSAGVVDRLLNLSRQRPSARFILGNHEEVFLQAIDGDRNAIRAFCRIGGRETILSYGVARADYERMDYVDLAALLPEIVPPDHIAFLRSFEDMVMLGDYAFVHAGVRPGVALEQQRSSDLRWIRNTFLDHQGSFGRIVVHGHTIRPEVEVRPNRIGIDTGAYESGRLTALGLESDERWFLQTQPSFASTENRVMS